jgi:hypothetical protein
MSLLDGRNRAHAQRIRSGCNQHPEYKGKGTPPDPFCGRCGFIHEGWNELVAAMNDLLKD